MVFLALGIKSSNISKPRESERLKPTDVYSHLFE